SGLSLLPAKNGLDNGVHLTGFGRAGSFEAAWFTNGPKDDAQHYVLGVATDKQGNIYVTDHYRHCVLKYREEHR
ncbi:MAG: hypothetical protein AAB225_15450, partial [Acidobacteriota bacterium]